MDYNFNLKQVSQRKFKMSPFLQSNGLDRCFSTSSSVNVKPFMSNNLKDNPLLNFVPDLKTSASMKYNLQASSSMSQQSLSSGGVMSVSCLLSGFVGSNSSVQKSKAHCDRILWDVCVMNNISPVGPIHTSTATLNGVKVDMKTAAPVKRTYAEVTKEKPKPQIVNNCTKRNSSCDNFTVLHSHSLHMSSPNKDIYQEKAMDMSRLSCEGFIFPKLIRQQSCSSSSDSSIEVGKMKTRTISDCSTDSDDSYIIFQPDESTTCDYSDGISSDESDAEYQLPCLQRLTLSAKSNVPCETLNEVEDHQIICFHELCLPPESIVPSKKVKKVRFKPDGELVKVHTLVTWNYASRAARVGPWEEYMRDRLRFKKKISDLSNIISPILSPSHREAVFRDRFMTA